MLNVGDKIGSYTITGELGRGGMGVVYRAHDGLLKRNAAVKMVITGQATPTSKRRFLREAAAIARCDHPGIIKVYSFGEHEGLPYLAMEYVDGKPLFSFLELARSIAAIGDVEELKKYGYLKGLSPDDEELPYFLRPLTGLPLNDQDYESHAAALIAGVADALYEAHSMGILHRDIKPSNILIGRKGPPKLADFGLAKLSDSSDITTGQPMLGTLRYMAPETFANRESSAASDIYSLGTLLYELLTLEHPFKGDTTAAFIRSVTQDRCPPPSKINPSVSPALSLVVMKCLEKDPARRCRNARELADAIRLAARPKGITTQILDGIRGLVRPSGHGPEPEPRRREERPEATDEDILEAALLIDEARRRYFMDFSVAEAHGLVLDALKRDPYSTDVNAMLAVMASHLGTPTQLHKAARRMRRLERSGPDADTRLRAGLLADHLEGGRDWLRKMEKYLDAGHEDPALLAVCARARLNERDHARAAAYSRRIARTIPGPLLFSWFVDLYHAVLMGHHEKSLEITAAAIKRNPDNVMLRYAMVQRLLELGRLDKAAAELDGTETLPGQNEFLHFLRAELAIFREDYKTACVELRKHVSTSQDDNIAYAYYRLSKLYNLRGDRKEALRHLEIGRNLAPELNFKTREELEALVEGTVEFRPSAEELPRECLELNFRSAKRALLDNILAARNNSGAAHSTVYIFDGDSEPRAVRAWAFFNEFNLWGYKTTRMFLPALPLSSFVDYRGNVLRTDLARAQSGYGSYLTSVTYAAPMPHLSLNLVETQLDLQGFWKERHKGLIDLRLDEPCQQLGRRSHILALPEDSEITELSPRPDEELKRGGWRFLVYSRFFFDCERFRLNAKFRHRES